MGQRNPVRFPLGPLFGVVFGKDGFMSDEGKAAVHQGVPELRRTVLDHMACKFGLAGLEVTWLQAGKGEHLGGVLELAEVSELRKDNSGGQFANAGQREAGRVDAANALLDSIVQLVHFGVNLAVQVEQELHLGDEVIADGADRVFR